MTEAEKPSSPSSAERPTARAPRKTRGPYPKLKDASEDPEAKRLCAVILDVLGGGRTPTDGAGLLGVSVPRYYALEARALGGLLQACGRRPKGRRKTPAAELATLRGQVKHLESQCGRLQALLRASQRVVGLSAPSPAKAKAGASKKRQRRPQVRALRAAATLRSEAENLVESSEEKRHDAREVKA
jgi:hypothetical protein